MLQQVNTFRHVLRLIYPLRWGASAGAGDDAGGDRGHRKRRCAGHHGKSLFSTRKLRCGKKKGVQRSYCIDEFVKRRETQVVARPRRLMPAVSLLPC
jgi:hypothetical protein